ncbi:TetR/AcrR family transcriptional regulator [Streptomyces sp. AC495_CC817]|uniref:TetR/AcrR family transcriptional regulator n=1 Tax=Streptomyces sp. AC495_CC817 TaxID=2823900 RepID=UPI001C265D79|nr:TetR/AcrR family transcriptional regulator [Streptomyces sp. AC495_CC817]
MPAETPPAGNPARKRGRPTEAERVQRRDDILDAAVRLLLADGFGGVTFDDIGAEARVTKRTIYAHFATRTEVFLAAVERLRERTLALPGDHVTLLDLATAIVTGLHSDEAVGLHRLMISSARDFPELSAAFYADGPERYIAALRERLDPASASAAEALFTLLLGEPHRRRLLGLAPAPTDAQASAHAATTLRLLGLD